MFRHLELKIVDTSSEDTALEDEGEISKLTEESLDESLDVIRSDEHSDEDGIAVGELDTRVPGDIRDVTK